LVTTVEQGVDQDSLKPVEKVRTLLCQITIDHKPITKEE